MSDRRNDSDPPTVGVVGLGIMGAPIAGHVRAAGFRVLAFDVSQGAANAWRKSGGTLAPSVAELAGSCSLVLTSLPSSAALMDTVAAIATTGRKGLVLADLSTLALSTKAEAREALQACGVEMLDCPISGTGAQALTRDLSVYASGDAAAYESLRPVFEAFAARPTYIGEFGDGTKTKLVANLLVAIHNVAAAEALSFAMRCGLDPEATIDVVSRGAGTSRVFELRAPLMSSGAYEPATMKLDVWDKDLRIIAAHAAALSTALPLFTATLPLYERARQDGGSRDTASVFEVLRRLVP